MHSFDQILHGYFFAKKCVISRGFANEIDWMNSIRIENVTESEFLKQASWVIIASGLNDHVVRKVYPKLAEAFYGLDSASVICLNQNECIEKAITVFKHSGKINAILSLAQYIKTNGFVHVKVRIISEGVNFLTSFPYLGKATSCHLAKNIGIKVAKPDRHLIRISDALGFNTPQDLCMEISKRIDEDVSTIDLVLWRYATIDKNYLKKVEYLASKYSA